LKILAAAALLLLAACTSNQIQTTESKAPARKYATVVVGDVTSTKPELQAYALWFRNALVQQLQLEQPFVTVIDPASPTPADGFRVTGELTEIDFGNTAARVIIGFGAGSQQVKGNFTLSEASGEALTRFSSSESYAGGAGIGGANLLSLEELCARFGKSTGQALARFARGEPLSTPAQPSEPATQR